MTNPPLTEREEGYIDAMVVVDENVEAQEKRRRAALSPNKKRIQAALDATETKIKHWDDAISDDDLNGMGSDTPAVWAAIDLIAVIHDIDDDAKKAGRARWFIKWVCNQAIAKLNT